MKRFVLACKAFIADEDGVSAIEYALLAALIGVATSYGMRHMGYGVINTLELITSILP